MAAFVNKSWKTLPKIWKFSCLTIAWIIHCKLFCENGKNQLSWWERVLCRQTPARFCNWCIAFQRYLFISIFTLKKSLSECLKYYYLVSDKLNLICLRVLYWKFKSMMFVRWYITWWCTKMRVCSSCFITLHHPRLHLL
jgi:hypothetical protein